MATIGDLVANLGVDRRKWSSGLKGAKSDVSAFVGGIARTLAPVAGIFGAALGVRSAINASRTQQTEEKKLQAVLKATAGAAGLSAAEIKAYAGELQGLTNFGDEATIGAAAVLATFKEIKGDTFKDALALGQDLSAVMGQDMKASAVQLGKALNDPIRGVTALSKVGVSFTEQQRQQIAAMQAVGNIAGAQAVILSELRSEFGGAARGMADPFTQAANILGDVAEVAGDVLLPPLREVLAVFGSAVGPITGNADGFRALGESIAGVVRDGLAPLVQGTVAAVGTIAGAADGIAFAFRNAADLVQLAMIDMNLGLYELIPGSDQVAQHMAGNLLAAWESGKAGFQSFLQNVLSGFREMWNFGEAVASAIAGAFAAILSGDNPLTAFADKFVETLAAQKDEITGGNPLKVMADTFRQTKADIEAGLADSPGLSDALRQQRQQLLDQVAGREAAALAQQAAPTFTGSDFTAGSDGTTESKFRNTGPGGLAFGSKEALEKLRQRELATTRQDDPAKIAKQGVDLQKKQLQAAERMARSLDQAARQPVIVGAFS